MPIMETMERSNRRDRRSYTPEFKAEIVERCRAGDRSIPEVARDFDLTVSAVRRWVAQAEIDAGKRPGLTSDGRSSPACAGTTSACRPTSTCSSEPGLLCRDRGYAERGRGYRTRPASERR